MLSDEEYRPYYRPALSDLLSEDLPDKRLYVFDPAWYDDNRVELRTGTRIVKIEPNKQMVVTEQDESIPYTKLIVATGASSNIPPFKGLENQGVYALRSLQDALRLKEAIKTAKKAVVIGAGRNGLPATAAVDES
jgi:NAD(P)H-nitrite reductase large subunit